MPSGRFSCQTLFLAVFMVLLSLGCAERASAIQDETPDANQVDYQLTIKPLLSDRCYKCHGPDEAYREAGLRLDTREDAFAEIGGGDAIIAPGSVDSSELFRRLVSEDPDEVMPPPDSNLSLSEEEIERIRSWIESGANWEEHWSFAPLNTEEPATIDADSWSRNEIDRFIALGHRKAGVIPASEASRERLLRRVYFDLTGLPPSLEAIDAFVSDGTDEAYEKAIDRLLASDAYGERMASDWLEISRYSDSYGYQVDRDRFVWPWRDWVIKAFNDNMSYDEFVRLQLAGDLIPNATDDQVLATTFSRLHSQKVEGGSVPEEFRNEYVADRLHTFATAFLGLTVECARCHDHKYDPLTQREYYQLYAYFNNIDEAGLYSYFTSSVPTPTMMLVDEAKRADLQAADLSVGEAEAALATYRRELGTARAKDWVEATNWEEKPVRFPEPIAALDFEEELTGPNKTVPGVRGNGVQLSGDDGIGTGVGNFDRAQSFSVEIWLNSPDFKERAVVFHRSRAWTDAASRGYELLLVGGKLRWSLIHFWPGNAISIETTEPLALDEWAHVVVTYDGSGKAEGLQISIDGEVAESTVVRDQLTKNITGGGGDSITIGERFRDRGFAQGMVDEFHVFDRRLSQAEIMARYRGFDRLSPEALGVDAAEFPGLPIVSDFFMESVDREHRKQAKALRELRAQRNKAYDQVQEIMVMREMETPRETHLLKRGAYDAPGGEVESTTPAALPPMPSDAPANRLGLANWLTGPAHPLAARVAVNHYWQMMFGQGLVRTPEDYGNQGSPPTHPELLDWLANDFVAHGWDVKRLLKQMALSATYRQDSIATAERVSLDPENMLLARGPHYRMSAEMLRDQALAMSGLLVHKIGGPPVKPYEVTESFKPMNHDSGEGLYRRSLYTFWKRTGPAPVMMALDASKRDVCVVKRERTATPLQSLVLLNDPQFIEASRMLMQRLIKRHADDDRQIGHDLFRSLTGRKPDERESDRIEIMYQSQRERFATSPDEAVKFLDIGESARDESIAVERLAAWSLVASTLMNLDECTNRQ